MDWADGLHECGSVVLFGHRGLERSGWMGGGIERWRWRTLRGAAGAGVRSGG